MTVLFKCFFLSGMFLIFVANLFMGQKNAPTGRTGAFQLPWKTQMSYSTIGHIVRLIGFVLWLISVGIGIFIRFG